MQHPIKRVLPWIAFATLYLVFSMSFFGLRSDMALRLEEPVFLFEMIMALAIAMSAALCSIWMCVPDMRGARWMLAVPGTLFSAFLVWTILRVGMEEYNIPQVQWHICYLEAFVFGVLPALGIFWLSLRGRTTQPILLSFMNALAFGGLGYVGLRLTCGSEDIAHICLFHIMPYILFGLLASLAGHRYYRW